MRWCSPTRSAQLDEYRKLAAATRDPWFTLIAENEAARAEIARGDRVAAERRLRDAIALAQREHLAYRAVRLEADLVKLHKTELALSQAADEALSEYRDAITAGEWVLEMGALSDLASIHHNRRAYNLARAYLTELALRADAGLAAGADDKIDCPTRLYAYESLANISLLELEPDHARAELVRAPLCDTQKISAPRANLILQNALVRSELYRLGHRAADAQLARDSLAALRELPANVAPGKDALLAYIEGDLIIKDDPATGQQSLRDAITRAAGHADEFSIKARLYSHALLALDAGRRSAFGDVIATVAESLRVRTPDRCAVAITVDADRSVVAFAGADAAIGGNYVAGRSSGQVDVTTLVPTSVVERMRGCEHVSVLTRAPILGAGRLLPPQLAWSYALVDPPAAPPAAAARRLVIANPQAPPDLSFPPLGPYPTEPGEPGVTILRGADATPSRVLAEMQNASVVEFHTHGFIADDLFEASYLVLSPELDRRYALTPDDVRQVRLAASPLVILGACHAATSSHSLEGGMGLAEAFLRAGARAVIASPDAVPDRDALAFFAAVRDRIVRGADPAVAVRDERTRRLSASHDESWASGVVVFQ
ncbi:MAG: CHAT domain-containing protein [Deltaproteobacteria bacterium]|nr:MAG: CHAT domain-containing protein [Deltaproteobacteria bacterium]